MEKSLRECTHRELQIGPLGNKREKKSLDITKSVCVCAFFLFLFHLFPRARQTVYMTRAMCLYPQVSL